MIHACCLLDRLYKALGLSPSTVNINKTQDDVDRFRDLPKNESRDRSPIVSPEFISFVRHAVRNMISYLITMPKLDNVLTFFERNNSKCRQ